MVLNGWRRAFIVVAAMWMGFWLFILSNGFTEIPSITAQSQWVFLLGPCAVLYAVGSGVAWTRRGFR